MACTYSGDVGQREAKGENEKSEGGGGGRETEIGRWRREIEEERRSEGEIII